MPTAPPTTFVVLLGAADWPNYPELDKSDAFGASGEALREYFGPKWLGLSKAQVCDLFDSPLEASVQLEEISEFVVKKIPAALAAAFPKPGDMPKAADLLVYYIGHGEYIRTAGTGSTRISEVYCVLPRCTVGKEFLLLSTSFPILSLFQAIAKCNIPLRKYLILDACYAAGASWALQSPRGKVIRKSIYKCAEEAFPDSGVALLCSSSRDDVSRAPGNRTMFTGALLDVLTNSEQVAGAPENDWRSFRPESDWWTLREVGDLVETLIVQKYANAAIRPEVHVPVKYAGDIATKVRLFPNPVHLARPQRYQSAEEQFTSVGPPPRPAQEVFLSEVPSSTCLSDLTLPEELYLLLADDSSANTHLLSGSFPDYCSFASTGACAAALAELVLADRVRLWQEEDNAGRLNIRAEVINQTPLGNGVLDVALICLAGERSPIDLGGSGGLGKVFHQIKDRRKFILQQLTLRRILGERIVTGFFSLFIGPKYPILAIDQQSNLRRKFSHAIAAGAPLSPRVAILVLIARECTAHGGDFIFDRAFTQDVKQSQRIAAIELAQENELARLIQQMVAAALEPPDDSHLTAT